MSVLEKIKEMNIPVVQKIDSPEDILSLANMIRDMKNIEGFIVSFADGHKIKIKTSEYTSSHKTISYFNIHDRYVVEMILSENMDDLISVIPENIANDIRDFADSFFIDLNRKITNLTEIANNAISKYGTDSKKIALEFVPALEHPQDASFIFNHVKGMDIRSCFISWVKKQLGNKNKYADMMKYIGSSVTFNSHVNLED